ncbi:MAG: thermonuclease family protein [Elusimicrobia bacterium]|nr:thermonuclease family protein [Elusimicrobiota bacterium]
MTFFWRGLGIVALGLFLWMAAFREGAGPRQSRRADAQEEVVQDLALLFRADGLYCADVSRLPPAAVVEVVDGDTLRIQWKGKEEFLRYYGINTPERDRPCYDEATKRNRALAGREVRLAFDERQRDRYGRLLAYVFTEDGRSIDAQLVMEGWARAWRKDGRFRLDLERLEREARAAKTGCLWGRRTGRKRKNVK